MFTVTSAPRLVIRRRPAARTWPTPARRSLLGRLRDRVAHMLGRLLDAFAPIALLLSVVAALAVDGRAAAPARRRVNLDDTRRCLVDAGCATCGAVDGLDVGTAETPVGVLCLTLCGSCAEAGDLPRFPSWTAAVSCVIEHCEHLGVTVDEAAAARRAECPGCQSSNTLDLGRGDHECRDCRHTFRPAR